MHTPLLLCLLLFQCLHNAVYGTVWAWCWQGGITNTYKWIPYMVQYAKFHQYSWPAFHSLHNWHLLKMRFRSAILVSIILKHKFWHDVLWISPTLTALILQLTVDNFCCFRISFYRERSLTPCFQWNASVRSQSHVKCLVIKENNLNFICILR